MQLPDERNCYFCGAGIPKLRLPGIGIGFGMCGWNFSFCKHCLTSMTADKFWQTVFEKMGYAYPPKLNRELGTTMYD